METTAILLWTLKSIWYFLIVIGIGGNIALLRETIRKNRGLLFNTLILWLAIFDLCYLIFLATHQVISNLLKIECIDDTTWHTLHAFHGPTLYLYEGFFSAGVLTIIILAFERYLVVCHKRNTTKWKLKQILLSIGNVQLFNTLFILCNARGLF